MKKNLKYILFLIFASFVPTLNLLAEVDYSYRGEEKKIVYIIGIVFLIIKIVVPILLIIISSFDLIKSLLEKSDSDIKKVVFAQIPKLISAVIIFLLPSLVALAMRLINQTDEWNEYATCISKPSSCQVELWNKEN